MIQITNLNKSYGKKQVLKNLSLNINNGVYGLLGENGAGKSTLMKILTTLIPYDSGEIKIFNHSLPKEDEEVRKILGYLPQHFDFFPNISVYDAMDYLAALKKLPIGKKREKEILDLLEKTNLIENKKTKVKHLSGGMKQRLGIAQSLLSNPKIIILDEPTVGLDPKERLTFRNLINELGKDRIILLSTHIVSDISSSCENLAILKKGKLLYEGAIAKLVEKVTDMVYVIEIEDNELKQLSKELQVVSIQRLNNKVEVRFICENLKEGYKKAKLVIPTLEDAYFYISFLKSRGGEK
ncbi:ABC transporter ATP-binding protein (plasmid) [Haloimpatiens sp. FM7330]|uniref:ABC transporter ATP-binding protein n=1 Tax=Haloimpatiens sp. FM7330 TaxID=3298610 RepID=UPI003631F348